MVCALQSLRAPLLKTEYLKPKLKTVSTKLSELPQSTTYHIITYKAHTGPCPLHRTEVRTNWGLAPCIGPKSELTDWDLVPCIGPESGLTGALPPASDQSPD